jgi:hypothetical protein
MLLTKFEIIVFILALLLSVVGYAFWL